MHSAVVASCLGCVLATPAMNRNIQLSGTVVPDIGTIQGFTYPRMGGTKGDQVTFGAYSESNNLVDVFDSVGGGFLAGINETSVDEEGKPFLGFGDFSLSSGNHPEYGAPVTAFVSSVSGADGVFVHLPDGKIITVVTTSTKSPSGDAYNFLSQPAVDVSVPPSPPAIYVTFAARAGTTWRGIVLATIPLDAASKANVELSVVADTDTTIPGTSLNYKCLSAPAVTPQGQVVFFGSHCGGAGSSQMVQAQWSNMAMYQDTIVSQHALTATRQVGVGVLNPGIWRFVGGVLSAVADDMHDVPSGSVGERFTAFSNPGVGVDGTTVFIGLGDNSSYGIFRQRLGEPLELVVSRKDDVPGYAGCKFSNFPQVPSVGEVGDVVFFGQCNSEVAGVFYEAGSSSDGYFGTLINYDDTIEGQNITYVGYGTNSYSADRVAMYLLLENSSNGVWTFDMPAGALVV